MRRIKDAFVCITSILKENRVPFMISGGFAARIYGSTRALEDIDIWIPRKHMILMRTKGLQYIIYGPKRYKDDKWDLFKMTLQVFGLSMDISAAEGVKIYDENLSKWVPLHINFHNVAKKRVFGKVVSVIKLKDLINYKNKLRRSADIKDVSFLKGLYKI